MTLDAVQESIRKLTSKANSLDGIIISIGIGALIVGILVDVFVIRLLCLVLVLGVAALVIIAMRAKPFDQPREDEIGSGARNRRAEGGMKKLVFDDLPSAEQASADHHDDFELKFDIPETRPFSSARPEYDSAPATRVPEQRIPPPGHPAPE